MDYKRMWTNLKEGLFGLIYRRPELEEGITAAMCLMDIIEILDKAVETGDFKGGWRMNYIKEWEGLKDYINEQVRTNTEARGRRERGQSKSARKN